jgi:hypothetical protein
MGCWTGPGVECAISCVFGWSSFVWDIKKHNGFKRKLGKFIKASFNYSKSSKFQYNHVKTRMHFGSPKEGEIIIVMELKWMPYHN